MHNLIGTELVATMETSQLLSTESFSYRWLVNIQPSFETFEESFGASIYDSDEDSLFIEMDPKLPASRRFFRVSQDFNFDFPISDSPETLVHADELISNGFLMPLYGKPKKMDLYDDVAYSTQSTPTPFYARDDVGSDSKVCCSSFRCCRRFSKQVLKKYLELVKPMFQKFGQRSSGSKTKAGNEKSPEKKRFICSSSTSPRINVAYSVDAWRSSCDSESSIDEAVLHCKRSTAKEI